MGHRPGRISGDDARGGELPNLAVRPAKNDQLPPWPPTSPRLGRPHLAPPEPQVHGQAWRQLQAARERAAAQPEDQSPHPRPSPATSAPRTESPPQLPLGFGPRKRSRVTSQKGVAAPIPPLGDRGDDRTEAGTMLVEIRRSVHESATGHRHRAIGRSPIAEMPTSPRRNGRRGKLTGCGRELR
jgi:hypothetical protein